jgi:hypothetical protein
MGLLKLSPEAGLTVTFDTIPITQDFVDGNKRLLIRNFGNVTAGELLDRRDVTNDVTGDSDMQAKYFNGIWEVANIDTNDVVTLRRSSDLDASNEVMNGAYVYVSGGNVDGDNINRAYVVTIPTQSLLLMV